MAVVALFPVQYFGPLFARLASEARLDLTVLYISAAYTAQSSVADQDYGRQVVWDVDPLAGYRSQFLAGAQTADPQRRWTMLGRDLRRRLTAFDAEVIVVCGWQYPANWLAIGVSQARRRPMLLFTDTDVRDPGVMRVKWLRSIVLGRLCRSAAGALYTGTFNRDFYIRHGVHPEHLWFAPWCVDNDRFDSGDRQRARKRLGLKEGMCYFLYVGKLIERKRPAVLVSALARLQQAGHRAGLLVAGSGPLEQNLEWLVKTRGVNDVHSLGFVNQAELPNVYAAADVFVLPSERDPRGAVVHEAMAAGLPVIVSSGTGVWGPGDLVRPGFEGEVFDWRDEMGLVEACKRLLDPAVREAHAAAASNRVKRWSYESATEGWTAAITAVASRRSGCETHGVGTR